MLYLVLTLPLPTQAAPLLKLNLTVRIATCEGKPVRDKAWLEAHVTAANKVFAPHKILLSVKKENFTPAKCNLITRKDRHALASHVSPGTVTVLVMGRIQDVDLPSYNLMGVHWRYRGKDARFKGRRWVFLTKRARPPVLAHELCHYLGLPHDPAGGNLMTPGPSDPIWKKGPRPKKFSPVLTATQARRIRARIRRMAARPTGLPK